MKTNLLKQKECKMRLSVEVEAAEVEARYQEVLSGLQGQAVLAGFRPGKAPLDLVEKRYVREVEEEVLKSLVPEVYLRAVQKHKVSPVSLPSISQIKMERGHSLKFEAEFEMEPEFNLKNYKGIKIKKVSAEVRPEDLEKGLTSLRESKAEITPILEARAIQKGDLIIGDIEVWQEGQYAQGRKGVLLAVEPNGTDDFYDKTIGAQIDEVREISAEGKPLFKVWIRQILEKKFPPVDEALAKHFGRDTAEDLREALRKDLARAKASESRQVMKDELYTKLLESVQFEVPEGLVSKQKERLLGQARREYERMRLPPTRFEGDRDRLNAETKGRSRDQVKLYFILKKIAEREKIEIDESELEKRLGAIAEESKRPIEEARRVFEEDLRETLREKQTVDFLLANAKLED